MNPTLYDILGVAPDASPEEIKRAWRDAAERFEPGSGGSPAQFRLFNEAAETLLDPQRRREYDAALAGPADPDPAPAPAGPPAAAGSPATGTPPAPAVAGAPAAAATTTLPGAGDPGVGDHDTLGAAATGSPLSRWAERLRRRRTTGEPSTASTSADPTDSTADTDTDTEAGAGADSGAPDARPAVRWPVLAALGVVALLLVALAAGPFVSGLGLQAVRDVAAQDALDEARRAAPAAAERAAEAILAYDYRSLEADRDAAARFMTPDYRKEYVETFDKTILDAAPQLKARVTADVRASGVSLATEDRVEVLLFVNQTTVSTANSGEEQRALNRVMFTMERSDGAWLVDDITSY